MARLRFPGRPGYRFCRTGLKYTTDDAKNDFHPRSTKITNLHQGLTYFYELFGESDEEDFDGFTERDVNKTKRKIKAIQDEIEKACRSEKPEKPQGKPAMGLRRSVPTASSKPTNQPKDPGKTALDKAKKTMDKMAAEGLVKPVSILSKVQTLEEQKKKKGAKPLSASQKRKLEKIASKEIAKKALKQKKILADENEVCSDSNSDSDCLYSISESPTPSNSRQRKKAPVIQKGHKASKIKQLIAKAKKGHMKKAAGPKETLDKKVTKKFVLPTVSSRSSRKIIPNKRFIEESEVIVKKRIRKPSVVEPLSIDVAENGDSFESPPSVSSVSSGKRARKLSMKMIEKLCDEDEGTKKLLGSSPGKLDSAKESEVTKRSGQSILRKAKLRLNQKKLNKSKAALARSLKRQMKKEGKDMPESTAEENLLRLQLSPVLPASAFKDGEETAAAFGSVAGQDLPTFTTPTCQGQQQQQAPARPRPYRRSEGPHPCIICGVHKLHVAGTYRGHPTCRSCIRVYQGMAFRVLQGEAPPSCPKAGRCDLSHPSVRVGKGSDLFRPCGGCRYVRCVPLYGEPSTYLGQYVRHLERSGKDARRFRAMLKQGAVKGSGTTAKHTWSSKKPPPPPPADATEDNEGCRGGGENMWRNGSVAGKQAGTNAGGGDGGDVEPLADIPSTPAKPKAPEPRKKLKGTKEKDKMPKASDLPRTPGGDMVATEPVTPAPRPTLTSPSKSPNKNKMSPSVAVQPKTPLSDSKQQQGGSGSVVGSGVPRIKHVCRRQAVALGEPAKFQLQDLRLSALPQYQHLEHGSDSDSDSLSMEEIISRAAREAGEEVPMVPKARNNTAAKLRALAPKHGKVYKRKMRCRVCNGCRRPDCGKCAACKDMIKYGGSGTMKKGCLARVCKNPILPNTPHHLHSSSPRGGLGRGRGRGRGAKAGDSPSRVHSTRIQTGVASRIRFTEDGQEEEEEEEGEGDEKDEEGDDNQGEENGAGGDGNNGAGGAGEDEEMDFDALSQPLGSERREFSPYFPGAVPYSPLSARAAKAMAKAAPVASKLSKEKSPKKYKKKLLVNPLLSPVSPPLPERHVICRDIPPPPDLVPTSPASSPWEHGGVALVGAAPFCVRTVCLLCGSAGTEPMVYCAVCCEPYHGFCLPSPPPASVTAAGCVDWCCPRCQCCHVCGRQDHVKTKSEELLQCDKCQDTYHPECLGPNYPTKPSKRKNIWLCTRCVRCKSCGATTPGTAPGATWMADFSLCFDCGKLMEKGNFCPICQRCYSDDDWESQMIQCCHCSAWVHAKCEDLTEEMYNIFTYLPEDIPFKCRKCSPARPAPWEQIIRRELDAGLRLILDTLRSHRAAATLEAITHASSPPSSSPLLPCTQDLGDRKVSMKLAVTDGSRHLVASNDGCDSGVISCPPEQQNPSLLRQNPLEEEKCPDSEVADGASTVTISLTEAMQAMSSANALVDCDSSESMDTADTTAPAATHPDTDSTAAAQVDTAERTVANTDASQVSMDTHCDMTTNLDRSLDTTLPLSVEMANEEGGEESMELHISPASTASTLSTRLSFDDLTNINVALSNAQELLPKSPEPVRPISLGDSQHEQSSHDPLAPPMPPPPRDLAAVADKSYASVSEFCNDVLRILRHNNNAAHSNNTTATAEITTTAARKKAHTALSATFVKSLNSCFPWFKLNTSRLWEHNTDLPRNMLPDAVVPPSSDHTYAQWLHREPLPASPQPSPYKKLSATPAPSSLRVIPMGNLDEHVEEAAVAEDSDTGVDTRKCILCQQKGDLHPQGPGRLLYAADDCWVHVNCALWSAEAYEHMHAPTLVNFQAVAGRTRLLKCGVCGVTGASVGCNASGCKANYHFVCARSAHCVFLLDKRVFCHAHRHLADHEQLLNSFEVERRMVIDCQKKKLKPVKPELISVLIGSMCVETLGRLEKPSDHPSLLFPIDYCVTRVYWSTVDPRRRCTYTLRVVLVTPEPAEPEYGTGGAAGGGGISVPHDPAHPRYDHALHLKYTGMKPKAPADSAGRPKIVELGEDELEDMDYAKGDVEKSAGVAQFYVDNNHLGTVSAARQSHHPNPKPRSSSHQQTSLLLSSSSSSSSSHSSCTTSTDQAQFPGKTVNLSAVSRQTLKLVNISDPSKSVAPRDSMLQDDIADDLCLGRFADRLNNAARRNNSRKKTTASEVRAQSQSPFVVPQNPGELKHIYRPQQQQPMSSQILRRTPSPQSSSSLLLGQHRTTSSPTVGYTGGSRGAGAVMVSSSVSMSVSPQNQNPVQSQQQQPTVVRYVRQISSTSPSVLLQQQQQPQEGVVRIVSSSSPVTTTSVHSIVGQGVGGGSGGVSIPPNVSVGDFETTLTDGTNNNITSSGGKTDFSQPVTITSITPLNTAGKLRSESESESVGRLTTPSPPNLIAAAQEHLNIAELEGDTELTPTPPPAPAPASAPNPSQKVTRLASFETNLKNAISHVITSNEKSPKRGGGLELRGQLDGTVDDKDASESGLNLRDQIVEKIKAESLARSTPSEQGPFKCPKCKLLYRTSQSYQVHVAGCNWEISTDEDEEEEANDDEEKSYPLRNRRSESTDSGHQTRMDAKGTADALEDGHRLRNRVGAKVKPMAIVSPTTSNGSPVVKREKDETIGRGQRSLKLTENLNENSSSVNHKTSQNQIATKVSHSKDSRRSSQSSKLSLKSAKDSGRITRTNLNGDVEKVMEKVTECVAEKVEKKAMEGMGKKVCQVRLSPLGPTPLNPSSKSPNAPDCILVETQGIEEKNKLTSQDKKHDKRRLSLAKHKQGNTKPESPKNPVQQSTDVRTSTNSETNSSGCLESVDESKASLVKNPATSNDTSGAGLSEEEMACEENEVGSATESSDESNTEAMEVASEQESEANDEANTETTESEADDCAIVDVEEPVNIGKSSPEVQQYVGGIRVQQQAAVPSSSASQSSTSSSVPLVTPCVVNLGLPVSSACYVSPPTQPLNHQPPAPSPQPPPVSHAAVVVSSSPSPSKLPATATALNPEALTVTNEYETTDTSGRKVKVVTVSRDQFDKFKLTMEKGDAEQELQLTASGELVYRPVQQQQQQQQLQQLRSPTRQILPKPAPGVTVSSAPPASLANSPPATMLLATPTPTMNILTLSPQQQAGVIAPVYAPQLHCVSAASHVQMVSGPIAMAPHPQMAFVTPTGEPQHMTFVTTANTHPQVSIMTENTHAQQPRQQTLSILTENPHVQHQSSQQQQTLSILTDSSHAQSQHHQQTLNILTENPHVQLQSPQQQQQQQQMMPLSLSLSGASPGVSQPGVTSAAAPLQTVPQTTLVASNLLRSLVTTGQILTQPAQQIHQHQQQQNVQLASSGPPVVSEAMRPPTSSPSTSHSSSSFSGSVLGKRKLETIAKAGPKKRKFMADTVRNQMIKLASQPPPANSNIRVSHPQGVKMESYRVTAAANAQEGQGQKTGNNGTGSTTTSSTVSVKKRMLQQQHQGAGAAVGGGLVKKRLYGQPSTAAAAAASLVKKRLQHHATAAADAEKRKLHKLLEKKKQSSGEIIRYAAKAHSEHHLVAPHQKSFLPEAAVEEEVIASSPAALASAAAAAAAKGADRRGRCRSKDKKGPYLVFEITSDDGFHVRAESCDAAWQAVTSRVSDARAVSRLRALAYPGTGGGAGDGATMFGLRHPAVLYLLEQLHGASRMRTHVFQHRAPPSATTHDDDELEETAWGCMRAAPFTDRKPRDMFSFLLSRYRPRPKFRPVADKAAANPSLQNVASKRATASSLPVAMRFRHLRRSAKEAVGAYYSNIHGRGLFCKREIDQGEMIIEYAGEVIRAALCDQREKYYESKHIGCYMFRVDDDDVVDATMMGNAARFINHSCDPNCYSKVINIGSKKHIVIFAQRPIKRGEELTYDYKFPIEEVKIPCTCNAKRCRKYLN